MGCPECANIVYIAFYMITLARFVYYAAISTTKQWFGAYLIYLVCVHALLLVGWLVRSFELSLLPDFIYLFFVGAYSGLEAMRDAQMTKRYRMENILLFLFLVVLCAIK